MQWSQIWKLLSIWMVVLGMLPYISQAQVQEADSLALVALYNATNGPEWMDNENWLTGPVATWYGVTVDEGQVTELRLYGNQLSGAIPSELGNLSNLVNVYLHANQLSGVIPSELRNLSNLEALYLGGNQLSGSIPPALSNLSRLINLSLRHNQFSGSIPWELSSLPHLQELDLCCNELSGSIPPELGNLSNLQHLDLIFNELSGPIPSELGNLSKLRFLSLRGNQLGGAIPPEIGILSSLEFLSLRFNQFTGSIPLSFVNLDLGTFYFEETSLCVPNNTSFEIWLQSISPPVKGTECTTTDLQDLMVIGEGQGGLISLNNSGVLLTFNEPSDTDGILTVNRIDGKAPNNDEIIDLAVGAANGSVKPDVVSADRYWLVTAPGLSNFSYHICFDITGLPKVDKPDRLVLVKREQANEGWMPLNTTLVTERGLTYLCADDLDSFSFFSIAAEAEDNSLPVESETTSVRFVLEPVHPNPFYSAATVSFKVDHPGPVQVEVYNMLGQRVQVLFEGMTAPGQVQKLSIEGSNLPSGVYLIRLVGEQGIQSRQVVLAK